MALAMVLATIAVATDLAAVGHDVGMHQLMRFQLVRVRELGTALPALEGPLARVHALMPPQVSNLDKALAANTTGEWLFTGVQADVSFKVVVTGEPLLALWALIWFLTSVGAVVVLEDMLVVEGLIAEIACILLFGAG